MESNGKSDPGGRPDRAVEQWQRRMLPAMRGALVIFACFFLVTTLIQYYQLYGDIHQQPSSITETLAALEKSLPESQRASIDYLHWRVQVMLEVDAMRLRHQHIIASQLMRAWTRYTGLLIGMVLALVGAFFILGRLAESESQLSGEAAGVKFNLVSSSPGIILAVLGCCLMLVTLYLHTDFEVQDRPVYMSTSPGDFGNTRNLPPPPELTEEAKEKASDSSKPDAVFPQIPNLKGNKGQTISDRKGGAS